MHYRNRLFRSRHADSLNTALLISIGTLVGAAAGAAAVYWVNRSRRRGEAASTGDSSEDAQLDDALNGTYPASDPPASHYTDIPANRR